MLWDDGHEMGVNITFKLKGGQLDMEACSPDGNALYGKRISEKSRKAKAKEIAKIIEGMQFPPYQQEKKEEDNVRSDEEGGR